MIKMNFDNKRENDDNQLIQLLKEDIHEFPSERLVEKTMIKISAMQSEKKFAYKPLRAPLYIMASTALLLLVPSLVPMTSNSVLLNPLSELLAYPESTIIKLAVWCWLTGAVLWISGLLFPIQLRFNFNLFKL